MNNASVKLLLVLGTISALPGCFDPDSTCDSDECGETEGTTGSTGTPDPTTDPAGSSSTGTPDPSTSSGTDAADTGSTTATTSASSSSTGDPVRAECGNGVVEGDEACDDGDDNGDEPDACRADCVLPSCGDLIVDTDEECDSEEADCLPDCTFDTIEFGPFPAAVVAIGQQDLTSGGMNGLGYAFRFPAGVWENGGRVYVSNGQGAGTFIWDSVPTESGVVPDDVLGRSGVQGPANPFGASSLGGFVRGISVDEDVMALGDPDGPRVLIFNSVPTTDTPADVVVGQPNFTSQETGLSQDRFGVTDVHIANDRMVVADSGANRVLVWNTIPQLNGALPVVVLGQANFNSGDPNRGQDAPDAGTMDTPNGVWTDGSRIAVADTRNHRILVWDSFPTENGQDADHVIGQEDMIGGDPGGGADGLNNPVDLTFVGNRMYIADQLNHRVMLFDGWPTADGADADGVVGQGDFNNLTSNDDDQNGIVDETPSARTLARPSGVHVQGDRLYVVDAFNHRVLVFEAE